MHGKAGLTIESMRMMAEVVQKVSAFNFSSFFSSELLQVAPKPEPEENI